MYYVFLIYFFGRYGCSMYSFLKKTHPSVKTKRTWEGLLFCLSVFWLLGTSFYKHWWLWFQNSWHQEGNLIDYPTKPPVKVTSQEFFIPSSYFCWEKVLVFTSKKGWNVQPPKNIDPNEFFAKCLQWRCSVLVSNTKTPYHPLDWHIYLHERLVCMVD